MIIRGLVHIDALNSGRSFTLFQSKNGSPLVGEPFEAHDEFFAN
jgi:hypothetical protein